MKWSVVFLSDADQDVASLRGSGFDAAKIEAAIIEQFAGFKGDRIQKLLESGTSSGAVDRLDASEFPTSIRIQVLQDLRATAWVVPALGQVVIVQVFQKSRDPTIAGPRHSTTSDSRCTSRPSTSFRRNGSEGERGGRELNPAMRICSPPHGHYVIRLGLREVSWKTSRKVSHEISPRKSGRKGAFAQRRRGLRPFDGNHLSYSSWSTMSKKITSRSSIV